jgi:cytochrome c peroxidase
LRRLSQWPVAVGGNSFQKMGVVEPYKATSPAEGRVAVTGKDADRFNFKVPTLRNVELTYPYFHDGAADTLSEAVETMGRVQLGKKFSPEENAKIVAFLKTLTGDQPSFKIPAVAAIRRQHATADTFRQVRPSLVPATPRFVPGRCVVG